MQINIVQAPSLYIIWVLSTRAFNIPNFTILKLNLQLS